MKIEVSFPRDRPHNRMFEDLISEIRLKGQEVKVVEHPVIDVPDQPFTHGDDLPNVTLNGKVGVGRTGLIMLQEVLQ